MHTEMRVHIELDGHSTIRVPTRESSKVRECRSLALRSQLISSTCDQDWDYDKFGSKPKNQQRKYGWMDIDVGPKSSIRYVMPLVASQAGFDALMDMEFYGLSASSSINYANFLKTSVCRVSRFRLTNVRNVRSILPSRSFYRSEDQCRHHCSGMRDVTGLSMSTWLMLESHCFEITSR